MVKHVRRDRSLVAKLAQPQSSQVELVSARWSRERKAQPWALAVRGYMRSIVALRGGISEERHALREQCLAEHHWALVLAVPRAVNGLRQSARVRARLVPIFTRGASVITDVTS